MRQLTALFSWQLRTTPMGEGEGKKQIYSNTFEIMSLSIEILPLLELKDGWKEIIKSKETNISIAEIKENSYFRVFDGQISLFDFWKSNKGLSADFFGTEDYFVGLNNLEKLDLSSFLLNFKKISYTIILESKPTRKDNELEYMILFAKRIAEITEGIMLFDHDILNYKSNFIYFPVDLMA